MLLRLAWKNLWRNRSRTLITGSAVFFSVVLSVLAESLKTGIFENLVENVVGVYSGKIQVHAAGYWDERLLDNSFKDSDSLQQAISSQPGVYGLTPRLESFALAAFRDKTKGCMVIGVDPKAEDRITALKGKVSAGTFLMESGKNIVLAEGLARRMGITLQDTVALISQGYHGAVAAGKFCVSGLLHFGSPDLNDKAVFLSLHSAREFFSAENIATAYVIEPRRKAFLKHVAEVLRTSTGPGFETMTWEEMMPEIKQHIETDSNNMFIVQCILYLLISFGIFSTLLMLMEERRFESGMLVALGLQKSQLARMYFMESMLTVSAGCILGIGISIPVVDYFRRHPLRIGGEIARSYERFGFEAIFPMSTNPSIFLEQAIIVFCIGSILSLYPVFKTFRLDPVKSMRN